MMRSRNSRIAMVLTGVLVLSGTACTEAESRDAPTADRPEPVRVTVADGTSMTFRVDRTVSTDDDATGDRFTATLLSNLTDLEGNVVVEEGATSRWVVTQSTSDNDQTLLVASLESIDVDGVWRPVVATVTDAELHTDAADSDTETAAKIGVGAAAGAMVGQILGKDTESTLKGAGVGAVVGAAIALSTRGGKAELPEGARITVRLDEPLVVS